MKIYTIKHKGFLTRLKKSHIKCSTCGGDFQMGDEVVKPSKSAPSKARRHLKCATKVGIETGEDVPLLENF